MQNDFFRGISIVHRPCRFTEVKKYEGFSEIKSAFDNDGMVSLVSMMSKIGSQTLIGGSKLVYCGGDYSG